MTVVKQDFYSLLIRATATTGPWVFHLFSRAVALGYFFFAPGRTAVGRRFYRALFPERSGLYHLWCTFRQFQNFTTVFLDRFRVMDARSVTYSSLGWSRFEQEVARNRGAIVLMSHVGNWDSAAFLFKKRNPDLKLMLYMGRKAKEEIETLQKNNLAGSGIRITAVEESGGSPLDVIEGVRFLRQGGVVSLTGDRLWNPDQKSIPVQFLGHIARIPEFPYVFALLSGAPLFVFFTFRETRAHYLFSLSAPLWVRADSRYGRRAAIRSCALTYARLLEQAVREHPFEWYHFDPFLEEKKPWDSGRTS